jgi:hypothetical protein
MIIRTVATTTPAKSLPSSVFNPARNQRTFDHTQTLRDRGFVVLDDDEWRLPTALVDDAKHAVLGEIDDLLSLVPRFGCDPLEQNYNFAEICHRSRKRWDMRVPGEAVSALTSAAVQAALPVVLGLDQLPSHPDEGCVPLTRRIPAGKPRMLMTGAIVSHPGATAQRFHCDADDDHLAWSSLLPRHRMYNVFVPLVDVQRDTQGTQFWPGSHHSLTRRPRYRAAMQRSGALEADVAAMGAMEAPACRAGGLVVFDFRLMHRGLPNDTPQARPVAYAVLGRGGARDGVNFPKLGLRDSVAAIEAEGLPADELEAFRRSVGGHFPGWASLPEAS